MTDIDEFAATVYGTKPAPPSKPPAPLRTNNPGALMPKGQLAQFGTMEEGLQALDRNLLSYHKQGINTLSGVINKWSPGNAPGNTPQATQNYINHVAKVTGLKPDQPIDLSNPLVRLQLTAGITQFESGPGAIYGQAAPKQTPQAEKPPRYEVSGVSDESMAQMRGKTPSQMSVEDLMKPEAIDAFAADVYNQPLKQGKIASRTQALLRGSAALADTVYGVVPSVVGMATYAGARATGQTPEQAAATQAQITGQLERPFGKALGVTETPEYKGEASQRLMQFISENIDKGADWISQKTGMSKADVDYYLNLGLTAAPFSRTGQRVGQAVKQEAGYAAEAALGGLRAVTPESVQRPIARAAEVVAPGTTRAPATAPTVGAPTAPVVQPPAQFGSVGAAATPSSAMIQQALSTATPEFQSLYAKIPIDKVKNTDALLVRLEGDSLPVPVRFTEGQATGNVKLLSEEMNMRGADPRIAQFLQENNQALIDNLPAIRSQAAPDSFATTKFEAAQNIIDAYKQLDVKRNKDIDAKYEALRTASGGELTVDAPTLIKNIDQSLKKELLLTDGQGMSPYRELKGLADSGQMTFDNYLALRRNVSRLSAEAKDGNVRQAARIMVDQLDALPLTAETAALKPLADAARRAARERFAALKKDPAYRAAVNETVPADKYFDKFVVGGVNKNLNTMIGTFGRDSVPHQNVMSGTMDWLQRKALQKGVEGRQNFSAANFEGGLQQLRANKNFEIIFNPETRGQLEILSRAASRHNFQPRGSYINNSNTFNAWMSHQLQRMGDIAGLKFMGGVPLGTMVKQRIQESKTLSRGDRALDPLSGIVED